MSCVKQRGEIEKEPEAIRSSFGPQAGIVDREKFSFDDKATVYRPFFRVPRPFTAPGRFSSSLNSSSPQSTNPTLVETPLSKDSLFHLAVQIRNWDPSKKDCTEFMQAICSFSIISVRSLLRVSQKSS